jgi:ABC-type transport system involved in multi-copper enzyme maturation permease subunit
MFWIELALLALLAAGLYAGIYAVFQLKPMDSGEALPPEALAQLRASLVWPTALVDALGFAGATGLGNLLVIALVGAVTAQEYTWRTMPLWLSHGVSRSALLGAKFGALLLPTLLVVLTPLVASGVLTAFFSLQLDGSLNLSRLDLGHLALSTLRTAYTLLPYAAFAFLLAVLTRSTVATIGGGLAYALILEGLLSQILSLAGGWAARLVQYLPNGLSAALLTLNQASMNTGMQVAASGITPEVAALGLGLYTLVLLGLAVIAFRQQDLTG